MSANSNASFVFTQLDVYACMYIDVHPFVHVGIFMYVVIESGESICYR